MSDSVLLLDGRALSCLAFARQLHRGGMTVHVGEEFRHSITAHSRATVKTHLYPSAESDPEAFKRELSALIDDEEYDFVIPVRDATTALLAEMRNELPDTTNILLDTPEKIDRLRDKKQCAKLAEKIGVPIPNTYYPAEHGIGDIQATASFPVLVKPTRTSGARGIRRAETPGDLPAAYRAAMREVDDVIVQEFVDHAGGHFSIGTVFDHQSRPQGIHVYEELIQYPDSGGPAIRAASVDIEPWVYEILSVLEAVDWTGPAHMDVLLDPSDGIHKLLEVNPRIWASVSLSIASGVDVPGIILKLAKGGEPSLSEEYATDIRYRWLLPNEMLWAGSGQEKTDRIRELKTDHDGPVCYAVLSRRDPGVVIGVLTQSLRFLLDSEKRSDFFERGWGDE